MSFAVCSDWFFFYHLLLVYFLSVFILSLCMALVIAHGFIKWNCDIFFSSMLFLFTDFHINQILSSRMVCWLQVYVILWMLRNSIFWYYDDDQTRWAKRKKLRIAICFWFAFMYVCLCYFVCVLVCFCVFVCARFWICLIMMAIWTVYTYYMLNSLFWMRCSHLIDILDTRSDAQNEMILAKYLKWMRQAFWLSLEERLIYQSLCPMLPFL